MPRLEGDSAKARRKELTGELKATYWKLDPYIRAWTMYDRVGMIEKINFYSHMSHWRCHWFAHVCWGHTRVQVFSQGFERLYSQLEASVLSA